MSDLRTAALRALEAMDDLHRTGDTQVFDLCHRETTENLRAALAEPGSDYERGFVDGMLEQARRSVDKAVNAMAEPFSPEAISTTLYAAAPIIKPEIKEDKPVPPPEAQTEAEKIAYCAGWWAALEAERKELLRIAEKP